MGTRLRYAVSGKRVGTLPTPPSDSAHYAFELRALEQIREALTAGADSCIDERGRELSAGAMLTGAQRLRQGRVASSKRFGVQVQLSIPPGVARNQSRSHQGEHPMDVGRRDELPGPAKHVGTKDRAVGEGPLDAAVRDVRSRKAQRHGPLRRRVVLGLDRAEPCDELRRRLEGAASELLSRQAPLQGRAVIRAGPPYGLHVRH